MFFKYFFSLWQYEKFFFKRQLIQFLNDQHVKRKSLVVVVSWESLLSDVRNLNSFKIVKPSLLVFSMFLMISEAFLIIYSVSVRKHLGKQ